MSDTLSMQADRERVLERIDTLAAQLIELSHRIHAHPETRFEEYQASSWLAGWLEQAGFYVERPVGGLATAFRATRHGGRRSAGAINVALLCEYDALEGIGHGCGHNLIAVMSLGAALAVAPLMEEVSGTLTVLGTPGEEGGGGKIRLLQAGVFEGVDAALMLHPYTDDWLYMRTLARVSLQVTFHGKAAHAATAPHEGLNALDAVLLAFAGINALRQHVPPDVRLHGIITEGGHVPNVIPERAQMRMFVRAADRTYLYGTLLPRVRAVFEGAAHMTGTRVEVSEPAPAYDSFKRNAVLERVFLETARQLGRHFKEPPAGEFGGSTDVANVSHHLPTLHPMINILGDASAQRLVLHSREFAQAAISPEADRALLDGARLLALTVLRLLREPALVEEAWRAHRAEVDAVGPASASAGPGR